MFQSWSSASSAPAAGLAVKLSYGDPGGGTAAGDRASVAARGVVRGFRVRRRRTAGFAVVRAAAKGDRRHQSRVRSVHDSVPMLVWTDRCHYYTDVGQ